jgi:hypothetical protein
VQDAAGARSGSGALSGRQTTQMPGADRGPLSEFTGPTLEPLRHLLVGVLLLPQKMLKESTRTAIAVRRMTCHLRLPPAHAPTGRRQHAAQAPCGPCAGRIRLPGQYPRPGSEPGPHGRSPGSARLPGRRSARPTPAAQRAMLRDRAHSVSMPTTLAGRPGRVRRARPARDRFRCRLGSCIVRDGAAHRVRRRARPGTQPPAQMHPDNNRQSRHGLSEQRENGPGRPADGPGAGEG